jgi:hypothetical protein
MRRRPKSRGNTLIDCRRGASDGADAVPGLIVLRRSMKNRMIGGVR